METKTVVIDNDYYELTAVPCDVSGAISIELLNNIAPIIVSFFDGNVTSINYELRNSLLPDKLMRICSELINVNILKKNGEIVKNWKLEFARKPLTFFRLGIEALRFNCEDFFTFMSGFVKEKSNGQDWKEVIKNLKEDGVEVPPLFSLLFPYGEETIQESPQV